MSKATGNRIIYRLERLTAAELEELDRTTAKMIDRAVMAVWNTSTDGAKRKKRLKFNDLGRRGEKPQ